MRALADRARIQRFRQRLGEAADAATRAYFTGGATAVLQGARRRPYNASAFFTS